jgi:hypothetical protein
MKPLFTLHAGEIVVGQHIEHNYRNVEVWVPTKDTGVDILVTGKKNKKAISLQVKYSKNFPFGLNDAKLEKEIRACGWWTLYREKIVQSDADYWIFVLRGFESSDFDFIILPPAELLRRLDVLYTKKLNICHTYICVTEKKKCWTTRGLGKTDMSLIAQGQYKNDERDFGDYLNNWNPIKELNG